MGTVVREGGLFKLPTWSTEPATMIEKQFKLRYFTLRSEEGAARLVYYRNKETYDKGGAPLGSINVIDSLFERVNKLDFVLTNDKKRLWCRAFSEELANSWEAGLAQVGAGRGLNADD